MFISLCNQTNKKPPPKGEGNQTNFKNIESYDSPQEF